MQIVDAIRITRGVVKKKLAYAATARAHPFIEDERWMQHIAAEKEREAKALKAVCVEVERLRSENERLRGELEEQRTRRIRQVFEHR